MQQTPPKTLKDESFIIPLGEISHKEKLMPISHEEKTNFGKSWTTMTDFMVTFYEKLSWVMLYVKNSPSWAVQPVKPVLKKKLSVIKPPMKLRIFIQRS